MSEFIAVEGLTISHSAGSLVSGGIFTITSTASRKAKCAGNAIYHTKIDFTFTGGTHSSGVSGSATGSGTISATAQKVKVEGGYVMRLGDSGSLNGVYVPPATPPPTVAFTSSVEIADSGQNKVRAS